MKQVAIIGAGPGGLMAAEVLSQQPGLVVTVYDAMPSAGRKFLQAGRGGLNITHSKPLAEFIAAYGEHQAEIEPWINEFTPTDVQAWVGSFGLNTFVGSSGRVYPQDMKAAPLLRKWLHRLREQGTRFAMRHQWLGWTDQHQLVFKTPQGNQSIQADLVVLALGGASWPHLGSDGRWIQFFDAQQLTPFQPANSGFNLAWTRVFADQFAGKPLKTVALSVEGHNHQAWYKKGECLITQQGIEGSLIYALSAPIRDALRATGQVNAQLDLMPDIAYDTLLAKLSKPRGKRSWSSFLKRAGLDAMRISLLRERLTSEQAQDMKRVAHTLKHFDLALISPRPIAEAISSAGGLKFQALNECSEVITRPGCYALGEMLDWEAPTGGYLLTAVLAQARYVAHRIIKAQANMGVN